MTTTPQKKLTGPALIERVEANMETHDVHELIEISGYTDTGEWAEALKKAKEEERDSNARAEEMLKTLVRTLELDPEELIKKNNDYSVYNMMGTIGGLSYRWLTYQYALENGFEDEQLKSQQDEFKADILHTAKLLRVLLGNDAGMLITDTILVQTNLLAYIRANGWAIFGAKGSSFESTTEEEFQNNFERIRTWAIEQELMQEMLAIGHLGMDTESTEAYVNQQDPRCSMIATYLRTQIRDHVNGTNHCDSDSYRTELRHANLFTHFLEQNCPWTINSVSMVVWACIKYDFRDFKAEDVKILEFAEKIVQEMADNGKAVAAEIKGE